MALTFMLSFLVIARPNCLQNRVRGAMCRGERSPRTEMGINHNQRFLALALVQHLVCKELLETLSNFSTLQCADIFNSSRSRRKPVEGLQLQTVIVNKT
jgi:hypothetical protein